MVNKDDEEGASMIPKSSFISKRKLFSILAFMLAIYVSCFFVTADLPQNVLVRVIGREYFVGKLDSDLKIGKKQWAAQKIRHYEIEIENLGYSDRSLVCDSALLEIDDENLVGITGIRSGYDPQWCRSVYSDLTISQMFSLAEESIVLLQNYPLNVRELTIERDNVYGFITHLKMVTTPTTLDRFISVTITPPINLSKFKILELKFRKFRSLGS